MIKSENERGLVKMCTLVYVILFVFIQSIELDSWEQQEGFYTLQDSGCWGQDLRINKLDTARYCIGMTNKLIIWMVQISVNAPMCSNIQWSYILRFFEILLVCISLHGRENITLSLGGAINENAFPNELHLMFSMALIGYEIPERRYTSGRVSHASH